MLTGKDLQNPKVGKSNISVIMILIDYRFKLIAILEIVYPAGISSK